MGQRNRPHEAQRILTKDRKKLSAAQIQEFSSLQSKLREMNTIFTTALTNARETVKEAGQQAQAKENTAAESGGVQYSFKGVDKETGRSIYQSNFPIGTPKSAKAERILHLIQDVWSKKPLTLIIGEGEFQKEILARFDPYYDKSGNIPTDASKLMGGNRHGSAKDQRVTLDLADDYYTFAQESSYNYSKAETGKTLSTHQSVQEWHYFIDNIMFQEYDSEEMEPYTVTVNVKERDDGNWVYSFNAERQKEGLNTPGTLHAPVNQSKTGKANAQPSDYRIAEPGEEVKEKPTLEKNARTADKAGITIDTATESASPNYRLKTWSESDYVTQKKLAARALSRPWAYPRKKLPPISTR